MVFIISKFDYVLSISESSQKTELNYTLQSELIQNEQIVSRSPSRADKADQGENASEPVSNFSVLQINRAEVPRLCRPVDITKKQRVSPSKHVATLNLSNFVGIHRPKLQSSPTLPKSPFLPQISPSMPIGSRSFTEKCSASTLNRHNHQISGNINYCSVKIVSSSTSKTILQRFDIKDVNDVSAPIAKPVTLPVPVVNPRVLHENIVNRRGFKRSLAPQHSSGFEGNDVLHSQSIHYIKVIIFLF